MKILKFNESKEERISADYLKSKFSIIKDFKVNYLGGGCVSIDFNSPYINNKGVEGCREMVKFSEKTLNLWKEVENICDQIEMDGYNVSLEIGHQVIGFTIFSNIKKEHRNLFFIYRQKNYSTYSFNIDSDDLNEYCFLNGFKLDKYSVDKQRYGSKEYYVIKLELTVINPGNDIDYYKFSRPFSSIDYYVNDYRQIDKDSKKYVYCIEIGVEDDDDDILEYDPKLKR